MRGYEIGEAVLEVCPRWLRRCAGLLLAAGLLTQANWATAAVRGHVQHRTASILEAVQPETPASGPAAQPPSGRG